MSTDLETTTPRSYASYTRPVWWRLLLSREAAVVAALVAVILWAIYFVPFFGNQLTMTFLLLDVAPIMLIALPMTLVIVTGEIDLSVASVVGLSSVLLGSLVDHGWAVPAAMLVALLAGLLCGLINGFLVAYVGLPSLAVTIGTLALFRGIAVGLLGTKAVTDFPQRWTSLAKAEIGGTGFPVIVVPFLVLALFFALLLQYSAFGRGVYDIGLNAEAAQFAGVSVARTKLVLFVMTSLVSAFAGIYFTLRFSSSRGDNATGLELQVIAAVLLGGVSIFGGRGKLPGVIAGVLLIGVLSSALRLQGTTVNVINIIIGVLLIASVMSTSVLAWFSDLTARRHNRGRNQSGPTTLAPAGVGNPKEVDR
ncbi:MAG TPA: ABC transporter permease [Marmoricola sp.]|jgi:rhamnose transport system permease protein